MKELVYIIKPGRLVEFNHYLHFFGWSPSAMFSFNKVQWPSPRYSFKIIIIDISVWTPGRVTNACPFIYSRRVVTLQFWGPAKRQLPNNAPLCGDTWTRIPIILIRQINHSIHSPNFITHDWETSLPKWGIPQAHDFKEQIWVTIILGSSMTLYTMANEQ